MLGCASALASHAQAGDTVYRLHGTVVDGVTGKPIPRALVESGDQRLATMTGSDGKFAIDVSVPPPSAPAKSPNPDARIALIGMGSRYGGSLYVMAQKPGYIASNRQTPLALDDTLSSTNVEIKLMPAAVITGHVSSINIDDAAGVQVTLLLHGEINGDRSWRQAGSQTTNAHGDFRFTNLRPGEYTLVTAQWQGDQPTPPRHAPISQRYPPTFYGDAHNLTGSTKFQLRYGDTTTAEFHLHLATFYSVTLPVTSTSPNMPVNARIVGEESFANYQFQYNRTEGIVEGALPGGDYSLMLSSIGSGAPPVRPGAAPILQQNTPPQQSYALVPIHVTSEPVRTASITLAPPVTIQVHINPQFTKQDDANNPASESSNPSFFSGNPAQPRPFVQILLRSEDNGAAFNSRADANSTDLKIDNVQPGHYFVQAQPFRGYVASMTSGGVDLFQHQLVVNPSGIPEPIDITLRDDTGSLTGTVNFGNSPAPPFTFIVLVANDPAGRAPVGVARQDGKFSIGNVAPGNYLVLAFPNQPPQIASRDPEFMHHFDGKGPTVTIGPGQSQQVDVPLFDDADQE
jgi:hypothetical protein